MEKELCYVFLLVDNYPDHSKANEDLKNVQVEFSSPNLTDVTQSMYKGINNNTKLNYKTHVL